MQGKVLYAHTKISHPVVSVKNGHIILSVFSLYYKRGFLSHNLSSLSYTGTVPVGLDFVCFVFTHVFIFFVLKKGLVVLKIWQYQLLVSLTILSVLYNYSVYWLSIYMHGCIRFDTSKMNCVIDFSMCFCHYSIMPMNFLLYFAIY